MIIIKDAYFDSYEEFADCIVDTYEDLCENEEFSSVDVIAKFDVAKEIVKELVFDGYDIALITNFAGVESDGYEDEFIISLSDDEIWVEPFKRGNDYITAEADVVYITDDCNYKCIPNILSDKIYAVEVDLNDESDECDGDCENCPAHDETYLHTSEDEDGNTHGFTASRSDDDSYMSYSFYSSDELSHEDIQKMLKAFGL